MKSGNFIRQSKFGIKDMKHLETKNRNSSTHTPVAQILEIIIKYILEFLR